jgi:alpha-tubulin suppressor-like RCC1 family protein
LGLGEGDTTARYVPTAVTWDAATNGKIVDVWAAGGNYGHVWIYTDTDKMFGCGYNNIGQIGTGDTTQYGVFTLVKDWSGEGGYKKFSVGGGYQYSHCAFISGNGKLWTWGENAAGQLGQGDTTDRTSPTQVGTDTDWQNVWAKGYNNTVAFTYACKGTSRFDNTLYACGFNSYGVLGTQSTSNHNTFTNCLDSFRNNMTNIIDVRVGGMPSGGVAYVEKYLADVELNQAWYKTQWYFQGVTSAGLGTIYQATATTYYMNYHSYDVPNWDNNATTGNDHCFHSNIRYATDINPYRMNVEPYQYNVFENGMIFYDRDVGRVYWQGYAYAGLSPVDTYADRASTAESAHTGWQMQPLPLQ